MSRLVPRARSVRDVRSRRHALSSGAGALAAPRPREFELGLPPGAGTAARRRNVRRRNVRKLRRMGRREHRLGSAGGENHLEKAIIIVTRVDDSSRIDEGFLIRFLATDVYAPFHDFSLAVPRLLGLA